MPSSLKDINQILSVNRKESLLSYCQQGLRGLIRAISKANCCCIVRDISAPAPFHPCASSISNHRIMDSLPHDFKSPIFPIQGVRVFGPVWFWNFIIVSPLHRCLLSQEIYLWAYIQKRGFGHTPGRYTYTLIIVLLCDVE